MTESISITNFLVIKKANVNVKKINVIIGPQANGKSVIAKLLYLFHETSEEFVNGIRSNKTKRELDTKILEMFEERFPKYSWDGGNFSIVYNLDNTEVSISGKTNARGKTNLKLSYSDNLKKLFTSKKSTYKKKLEEADKDRGKSAGRRNARFIENQIFYDLILEQLINGELGPFFSHSVFIPASRTFFANLQKNIFTFLASNLDIDPYLKNFGSVYENSKRWYKDNLISNHRDLQDKLHLALEAVVAGDYEYHDEQDWILSKGKRINLANASSGQQESLPMLLVLCVWPLLRADENGGMFFIEEPEAHLFPTSQSYIVSILSLLYSEVKTSFFITSHSPYILSALNNFILAGDAINEGKLTNEQFVELNGLGLPIQFEDVAAYTITDGILKSITDEEYRMVGGDILDGVSEHFEDVMNKILRSGE
jgi:predicted ATPase